MEVVTQHDLGSAVHPSATASPLDTLASVQAIKTLGLAGSQPIVQCFPQGALVVFDRDLRYLSAAGLGLPGVGLTRSMLEGNTIFEVFPPEAVAVIEPKYRLALDGVESAIDVPYLNRIYLMRLGPLRDADGAIVAGLGFTQDVTEARQAEGRLRESEERARLAFDHSPIGNALIDPTGRYLHVNQAMCDITGYSSEELLELSVDDITHPDDLPADVAVTRQLLAGDVLHTAVDKRYLRPSGHIVWVTKSSSLLRGKDGTPLHFIAQIQDITDRKNHEFALAEERGRLHEAELIGRMGSWDLNVDTAKIRWSDALFTLRGLDLDTFKDNLAGAARWVHPDDRERVSTAVTQCSLTGEPMLERYRATRASDGALRWFDARAKAAYEGTRVVRVAGTVIDVTDDVVAAERAAAAHAFQQAVISASPDIIFVYDLSARSTVWTNRSIAEALGHSCGSDSDNEAQANSATVADDFSRFVFPEDRVKFVATLDAARYAIGDGVIMVDHRMCHADGSTRWFSRRTTALRRDESGQVTQVVGVLRDLTARMKIEQERTELQARLAEAKLVEERAKLEAQLQQAQRLETVGQLAGGIAHDFNNLLAGITSYASLVASGLEELESRGVDAEGALTVLSQDVDEIVAGAKRAAELTRQLLIFSRREVVQPRVLDLNSVVADLEKMLGRTIGERIELRIAIAADAPNILADRGQVEQILMNLAVNARYAMPDRGQLRVETGQVELGARDVVGRTLAPGRYAHLTVTDTGTGMTTEVVDRAFEPFFSTKPKGEGSGLGLATVYGIATQFGGDVSISSEVGLGTIVRVLFPASTEAVTGTRDSHVRRPPIGRGETILLVEDEATVREPARRILARNAYTVLTAASGEEALEIVSSASSPIDLLLTDVVMPGRTGKELAGDVVALAPGITVVYMSGHSGDIIAHEGVLNDGVTLIEKPFTADVLLRTVRAALDGIQL